MRKVRGLILALLGLAMAGAVEAERFSHRFATGDRYRVISTASEDVYFNRKLSHRAEILNRIAFSVEDVRADGAGLLAGEFRTSTKAEGYLTYSTDELYESRYYQTRTGRYDIGSEYFMPVVRHVPTFPDRDLAPGDTWTAPGEERHDFRRDFGIPDPYIIPFDANYRYVGPRVEDGKTLHEIAVSYAVFHEPPPPRAWDLAYPVRISGYSDQRLFWDAGTGHLERYEETFRFVFDLSSGATVEYRGRAAATVVEAELMDRAGVEADLRAAVKDIPNVTVASDERGVTISLEDLRFVADSTRLLPGEDGKLALIAGILARYPDRDILVTGHTALAGTAEQRAALSLARARAVAERLVALKARTPERVVIEAYGAERPVAPNDSEANMARNRRVEITILEN